MTKNGILKVLFEGATMVSGWGGGEPVIADLLQRGLEELGVQVLREGSRRTLPELVALGLFPFDAEPTRLARYRRRLRELRPDVVIAWYDFDCSLVLAARLEGIPVISSVHIYWPTCPMGTRYIEGVGNCDSPELLKCLRHIARAEPSPNLGLPVTGLPGPFGLILYSKVRARPWVLGQANAIVANSEFMGRVLRDAGYGRVHVIFNGVDVELFRPSVERPLGNVVLYPVARSNQERKGYHHFAELARTVRSNRPGTSFKALNYQGDLTVEGTPFLSREDLAALLRSVYMAVVPGLWEEPFGLVAAEAMASGRPVVAYKGGGISEVIEDGVSGVLVPQGNLQELNRAVINLLDDQTAAERMGAAARARIETLFRYQVMAEQYLELIRDLID
ncbi:MAG: glycosyltransferase family 4 protein [Isosphaeraceae bacterium]